MQEYDLSDFYESLKASRNLLPDGTSRLSADLLFEKTGLRTNKESGFITEELYG